MEVYFDDFTVEHVHSAIVQAEDYYPFGLTFNGYRREESYKNRYLFNAGSELNEMTENYETLFRRYDPALGRFNGIDALADFFNSRSPYHYGYNNPIAYNDPLGLQAMGPGSGNHWSDQYRSVQGNLGMMSTNTFRGFYGLNDGNGGTNYQRAGQLGQGLAETTYVNEGYYSFGSSDKGKTWSNNGWTDVWKVKKGGSNGGSGNFTLSKNALGTGGLIYGIGETLITPEGSWLGKNGKYYNKSWGGNQWTGSRAGALKAAKLWKLAGRATFAAGALISTYEGIGHIQNKKYGAATKSGLDLSMGVVGLFGPIGIGVSGVYFVVDATIGWGNAFQSMDSMTRQNQAILGPGWSPYGTGGMK